MIIFAHRGYSGIYPENTILAFEKAFSVNTDGIEFDIQLTKDNIPIIFHDFSLSRLTNKRQLISELSLSEIKKIKLPFNQTIPTLNEILDIVPNNKFINLELKGKNTAKIVFNTLNRYIKNKKIKRSFVLVSSFNHNELKSFCKINNGKYRTGIIISGVPLETINFAKKWHLNFISASANFVTKYLVKRAHLNNLKIFVWTINSQKKFSKIKKLEIDGIFTDFPNKFKKM